MKRMRTLTLLLAALAGSITITASAVETLPGATVQPASYFYTGKPYDEDIGGYVFNYRNYSPTLNRWTTSDPSGFPDGANAYEYISNDVLTALDPDGLAKQKVANQTDLHVPNCFAWASSKGDGGDWEKWYQGNGSVFFQHLGIDSPKPTVANLAMKFVSAMLGLTVAYGQPSSWTAYGGDIAWTVSKDVQAGKTVWYFEYTASNMMQYLRSKTQLGNGQAYTPIQAKGELTATVTTE